jgi:hypothetical protein
MNCKEHPNEDVVCYTEEFNKTYGRGAMAVHGWKSHVIILEKLESPYKRFDGKYGSYLLEYRSLSMECVSERDQAYACVTGDEYQYYQRKEIEKCLRGLRKCKTLFSYFNLF